MKNYYFEHKGKPVKIFNIKELVNDFNFFDFEGDWIDEDKSKHGKFRYDQLLPIMECIDCGKEVEKGVAQCDVCRREL